jgi:hypothetical protein
LTQSNNQATSVHGDKQHETKHLKKQQILMEMMKNAKTQNNM